MFSLRLPGALTTVFICACFSVDRSSSILSWPDFQSTIDVMTDYYRQECPINPECSTSNIHKDIVRSSKRKCCSRCICHKNCVVGGFCCPSAFDYTDYVENSTDIKETITRTYDTLRTETLYEKYLYFLNETEGNGSRDIIERSSCTANVFHPHLFKPLYPEAYYLVTKCRENYPNDSDTYLRCIGTETNTELADRTPETSMITSITYKNKYCRICNEPDSFEVPWEPRLYCLKDEPSQIPPLSSLNDLIDFDKKDTNCAILFEPSNEIRSVAFHPPCTHVHISSCNVSGKWESYDTDIEFACGTLYSPIVASLDKFYNGYLVFKNIACFLCNSNEFDTMNTPCIPQSPKLKYYVNSPYAVHVSIVNTKRFVEDDDNDDLDLATFNPSKTDLIEEVDPCEDGSFFDVKQGTCREIMCPKDYRKKNNACIPIFDYMNGIATELKFKIKFKINFFIDFLQGMEKTLEHEVLRFWHSNYMSVCTISLWRKFTDNSNKQFDFFFIHAKIEANESYSYSYVRAAYETLVQDSEPFGKILDFENIAVDYHVTFADEVIIDKTESVATFSDWNDDKVLRVSSVVKTSTIGTGECSVTLPIGQTSFCARVALKPDEFEFENDMLIISPVAYHIQKGKFDISGNKVYICIDDFTKAFSRRNTLRETFQLDPRTTNVEYLTETPTINLVLVVGIVVTSAFIGGLFLMAILLRNRLLLRPRSQTTEMTTT